MGLGDRDNTSSLARPRYRSAFGPLTRHVKLGGHSLFMIDAPALVDEDIRREDAGERGSARGLPQDLGYLQHMRAEQVAGRYLGCNLDFCSIWITDGLYKDTPLILFTHIPLYRPSDSNCGPLREKGTIFYVRGEGYQTLLSPETSRLLLDELKPSVIFRYFTHFLFSPATLRIADDIPTVVMTTTIVNMFTPLTDDASPKSQSSQSLLQWESANQVSNSYRSPARPTLMRINHAWCRIKYAYTVGCMPRSYSRRLYSLQRAHSQHRHTTRSTSRNVQ